MTEMLQSIKDKRLRRELPRLNYETKWEEGENVVQVPEYNIAVQVTDLYPFRCPTLEIDGLSEKDYVAKFEEMTGVTMPVMNTYASSWCPVFGVDEIVKDYLMLKDHMDMIMQRTEPPLFSNSPTSTSTSGS